MPIDDGIRGAGPAPRRDRAPQVRGPARSGAAVVAVLHDLNLAGAHADRVAVVAAGQFVAGGTTEEVLTEPADRGIQPPHRRRAPPAIRAAAGAAPALTPRVANLRADRDLEVALREVTYDWEHAAGVAEGKGRSDVALSSADRPQLTR
jgi:ABC-type glutathione transport system ATPase component